MSDLAWGLQMTVLGMGLVFGLLGLLWGLLTLVQRFDRAPPPVAQQPSPPAHPRRPR
jgi:Na+-transporting methylmalonyl-CoA/oxaloacetate decarboxylase gamma subunit